MPIVADAAVKVTADLAPYRRDLREEATRNIRPVDVPVGADVDEFQSDIRHIRNVPEVDVPVDADTRQFKRKMNDAGDDAETLGRRMKTAMDPRAIFGALAAAGGLALGIKAIGDATNAAAEFADTVSATGIIFDKEAIPALEEWAEAASAAFGASKQDALKAANMMAVFGKSAGLAGDDLIAFSKELTQLGGDLASMFGGRTEDAIAAVGSALRGEFEPIRAYGVLLDVASLQDAAFRAGIIETTDTALTPQQRVLAAHAAILEQTTDAQGDFARTSEGMANMQRQIAAELENVTIEIGEELMPVMLELANWFLSDGIGAIRAFVDYLKTAGKNIGGFADDVADGVRRLQIFAGDLGKTVEDRANEIGVDVYQMKVFTLEALNEMGLGIDDAMTFAEQRLAGLPVAMTTAGREMGKAVDEANLARRIGEPLIEGVALAETTLLEAAEPLGEAAETALTPIEIEAQKVRDAAVQAMGDMLTGMANLFEDDDSVRDAWQGLIDRMSDPYTEAERKADTFSQNTIDNIRGAIQSGDPDITADTVELVNNMLEQIALMEPGALETGQAVPPALKDGMDEQMSALITWIEQNVTRESLSAMSLAEAQDVGVEGIYLYAKGMELNALVASGAAAGVAIEAARALYIDASPGGKSVIATWIAGMVSGWDQGVNRVYGITNSAGRILGHSLPTDGPLKGGAGSGGQSIAEDWIDHLAGGIWAGLDAIRAAAGGVSGALVPSLAMSPAAASVQGGARGGATLVGGTGGVTYILHVNGVQYEVKSAEEAIETLQGLGVFHEGRL